MHLKPDGVCLPPIFWANIPTLCWLAYDMAWEGEGGKSKHTSPPLKTDVAKTNKNREGLCTHTNVLRINLLEGREVWALNTVQAVAEALITS